jgi:hypothetical protein
MEVLKARFDEADVKIPFPQRELSGREETGGFRHAEATDSVPVDRVNADARASADGGTDAPADADATTNAGGDVAGEGATDAAADVDPDTVVEPSDEHVPTPDASSESKNGFGIGASDYESTFANAEPPEGDDDADDQREADGDREADGEREGSQ